MYKFSKLKKLKNKGIKVVIMKKPKFKFLEQVFDKDGREWVVVGATIIQGSIIYSCKYNQRKDWHDFYEHELYKTKKTG